MARMQITKITFGWVNQVFDTETKKFVSQEFVAGDTVVYEDADGIPVGSITESPLGKPEPYLAFNMVQPTQ